ncbi:secretory pathway protein Sec39-domain-containing protein [Trametes polyzona]|nr:secretory pathway protein Sec39-domain-containing protein [Trametes polyzona]
MRPLTEDESKAVFAKLANYIGKNLVHLIDREDEPHCFRLQKDRVFYVSESSMKLAISVARPNLISLGTCFGKFTKSGKFKLHITALDYLAQYAKYKVWIKPNGEMPFLYGNHVLKAHLGRITEDTPEHQGVVVFSMNDIPLGFGVTARSTVDTRKLDPTAIIVFHQARVSSGRGNTVLIKRIYHAEGYWQMEGYGADMKCSAAVRARPTRQAYLYHVGGVRISLVVITLFGYFSLLQLSAPPQRVGLPPTSWQDVHARTCLRLSNMATATTSSPPSLPAQWTALSDEELSLDNVEQLLKPIRDDLWVSAACADRILDDPTLQRSLLELGLDRTNAAVSRARSAASHARRGSVGGEDGLEEDAGPVDGSDDRTRHASLVSYFSGETADAQLCRIRAVLLERLDRLNTFVEICKEAPAVDEDEEEALDEEWEDDPWADGSGEPSQSTSSKPAGKPPIPLSLFLTSDLVDTACLLASQENFAALRILLERHGSTVWQYRFSILDSIPEYALAAEYRDLLPSYDLAAEIEQKPLPKPWREETDFAERPECVRALEECGIASPLSPSRDRDERLPKHPGPLSSSELSTWYLRRIDYVLSSTGMVDAALALVQHAASQGVPGLDEAGEDLTLIARLVYDTPQAEESAAEDWSLERWRSMDPAAVIQAYLAHSTEDTIARDIQRLVMPYLFVLESRAERTGEPDSSLAIRLLYDYILNAPLGIVATIFEASKPTLPLGQRVIRDDEAMARLALACLYGSDSIDEWPTMSRIFECLPAWDTPEEDADEADEADTTIASLGAFVTPSTTRPRATPSDLLIFFAPLPTTSLSRALDVLDVHLESGEILARWSVPAPLRWFLQSNANISEQRARANRMARRANASDDKLETQEDWEWLLEDMLKLSGSGESGSRSAFCLLSRDDIIRIFFSGLLSTGNFEIAKKLLRSSSVQLSLDQQVIEDICLACSQEFYDNATSGNYHFGDMKLAYDCLDVPAPSERIIQEKEFIEATSRLCSFNLMSRPGIPISPIEIRLTKDRLSLVSRVLSSNNDAYKHTQVILDLVHKLGFRNDVVAQVKTLAMLAETALQVDDFARAYETSEQMVNTVLLLRPAPAPGAGADTELPPHVREASEVCWLTCFQLGRHPEFPDVPKKLALLGRALEFCPAEKIPDVLAAWRAVEAEDVARRREELASRKRGARRVSTPRARGAGVGVGLGVGVGVGGVDAVASLASRLQSMHMPELHIPHSPDAAALANKAFSHVAANIPFSFGGRGRSYMSDDTERSRSGSRGRAADGAHVVSEQASRVLQKGIGWLLGADDE